MDETIALDLQKALGYLRDGNIKDARPILVQILKTNPEIDQAWYMLSFVVSDRKKRIYALQQVLSLSPDNDKAKTRLAKILSSGEENTESEVSSSGIDESPVVAELKGVDSEEEDDLLNSRLDVEETLKSPDPDPEPDPEPEPIKKDIAKPPQKEPADSIEADIDTGKIDASTFGEYTGPKRNWRRIIIRLAIVVVVIGGISYLVIKGVELLPGILENFNSFPQTSKSTEIPTSIAIPTNVGGGQVLPATWTPSPEPSITPTFLPSLTPTPSETPNS